MSLAETLDKPVFEAPARAGARPDVAARRRGRKRGPSRATPLGSVLLGLSFPLALLAGWWWAARLGLVPEQILPAPETIYETTAGLLADGSLAATSRCPPIACWWASGWAPCSAWGSARQRAFPPRCAPSSIRRCRPWRG